MGNVKKFLLLLLLGVSNATLFSIPWTEKNETASNFIILHTLFSGQQMCSLGPIYWCQSITEAKRCNAVGHCISKVWLHMELPADDGSVCRLCKAMVTNTREHILSNTTQRELRKILKTSCYLIPLKRVSKNCVTIIDEFIVEITNILASRMDPQTVCALCGLCNSFHISGLLADMKAPKPSLITEQYALKIGSDGLIYVNVTKNLDSIFNDKVHFNKRNYCPQCKFYLGKSLSFVQQMSREHLVDELLFFCGILSNIYSESCNFVVLNNTDIIYEYVQSKLTIEQLCEFVGLCEISPYPIDPFRSWLSAVDAWKPPADDDSEQCNFCKQLINQIKAPLVDKETRNAPNDVCQWTGGFQKDCRNLTKLYKAELSLLFNDNTDESNFQELCFELGACRVLEAHKINSESSDTVESAVEQYSEEVIIAEDEKTKITCSTCVFSIEKAIALRGQNKTKETISSAMDAVCNVIHQAVHSECLVFMSFFHSQIEKVLLGDMTTMEICLKFNLCHLPKSASLFLPAIKANITIPSTTATTTNPPEILMDPAFSVNSILSPTVKPTPSLNNIRVEKFKSKFSSLDVKKGGKQSSTVERDAGSLLDSKSSKNKIIKDFLNVTGDWEKCIICEYIASRIIPTILNHASEQFIGMVAEKCCHAMAQDSVREECQVLVNKYIESLIKHLSQKSTPIEACAAIKLCYNNIPKTVGVKKSPEFLELEEITDVSLGHCQLCKVVSQYMNAMMDEITADTPAEQIAEKICSHVPARFISTCKLVTGGFGPRLKSLLVTEPDVEEACSAVSLCTSNSLKENELETDV